MVILCHTASPDGRRLQALALQKVAGRTWHLGFPESRVHEKSLKAQLRGQSG